VRLLRRITRSCYVLVALAWLVAIWSALQIYGWLYSLRWNWLRIRQRWSASPQPQSSTQTAVATEQAMPTLALVYNEVPWDEGPLAVARYTVTDRRGRVTKVVQETYEDDCEGVLAFEDDVIDAIYNGVTVVVLSRYELEVFPNVCSALGR